MKTFILNICLIVGTISLMMLTTMLLDFSFIQGALVREIIVYLAIALEAFIGFRILVMTNKPIDEN